MMVALVQTRNAITVDQRNQCIEMLKTKKKRFEDHRQVQTGTTFVILTFDVEHFQWVW